MTDDNYTSVRAPEPAVERAREQKEAAGRTWGEQIVRPNSEPSAETDVQAVIDRIDDLEARLPSRIAEELQTK